MHRAPKHADWIICKRERKENGKSKWRKLSTIKESAHPQKSLAIFPNTRLELYFSAKASPAKAVTWHEPWEILGFQLFIPCYQQLRWAPWCWTVTPNRGTRPSEFFLWPQLPTHAKPSADLGPWIGNKAEGKLFPEPHFTWFPLYCLVPKTKMC